MLSKHELANAIRILSMDAVQKANSGHPGAPMGMAEIATVLWRDFLRHNPTNPNWVDRDRFVLSNGHGSMLLYSLLHLAGYDLSIDDIKNFRQLRPAIPSMAIHPASRRPPVHWGKDWPMRSAWPWPNAHWPRSLIAMTSRSSIITPTCVWVMVA